MDWTGIPPLASLRAFEAAARNRSYSAAGRELNVSHAAVAQQVRSLEGFLGLKLAERAGRGIATTPEGTMLAEQLSRGFGEVATAVRQLGEASATRPIHVTMTPGFAASWFLPRMADLNHVHPEIELSVNPTAQLVDFTTTNLDVAIRYGSGTWKGLKSEALMASDFVIVGAPDLIGERAWTGTPEDMLRLPWLQEYGTAEVKEWMDYMGLGMPADAHITSLPGFMLLSAVHAGQGIAATARAFVKDDIAEGRLVELYADTDDPGSGYYLVYRAGLQRPALKKFLAWLRSRATDGND